MLILKKIIIINVLKGVFMDPARNNFFNAEDTFNMLAAKQEESVSGHLEAQQGSLEAQQGSTEILEGSAEGLVADAEAEHGTLRAESGDRQVTTGANLKTKIALPLFHDPVASVRESTINPRIQKEEIDKHLQIAQESFKTEQAIISKTEIKFEATLLENNGKLTATSMKVKIKQIDHEIGTVDKDIHTTRIKIQKALSNKIIFTNGQLAKADASNDEHLNHLLERRAYAIVETVGGEQKFKFSSEEALRSARGKHFINENGQKILLTEKNSRVLEKHEMDAEDRNLEELRNLYAQLQDLHARREELIGQRGHLEERKNLLEEQRKDFERSEALRASLTPRDNPKIDREYHRDHEREEVADKKRKPGDPTVYGEITLIQSESEKKKIQKKGQEEKRDEINNDKKDAIRRQDKNWDIEQEDHKRDRINEDNIDKDKENKIDENNLGNTEKA